MFYQYLTKVHKSRDYKGLAYVPFENTELNEAELREESLSQ